MCDEMSGRSSCWLVLRDEVLCLWLLLLGWVSGRLWCKRGCCALRRDVLLRLEARLVVEEKERARFTLSCDTCDPVHCNAPCLVTQP